MNQSVLAALKNIGQASQEVAGVAVSGAVKTGR